MVSDHKEQNWLITVSLVIIAVVALAGALIYTRAVMIPFVVALFIVALVSPIEDFQVKWLHLPRVIAVIVTLLVVMSVIALVFFLIAQATTTIVSKAGEYSASFEYMARKVLEPIEYVYYRDEAPAPSVAPNDTSSRVPSPALSNTPPASPPAPVPRDTGPIELFPVVNEADRAATLDTRPKLDAPLLDLSSAIDPNVNKSDPNAATAGAPPAKRETRLDTKSIVRDLKNYIFNIVTNAFGTILGLISGVFFISIFVIFLLAGRNPYAEHSEVYRDIVHKVRRYVGTKVVVSAITGLLVWTSLSLLGLELASVFGVLAFLLNFIPSIGSIIATFLPIPIAAVQFQSSPWMILLVVAIPGMIQNILGNIVEPKLMGEGLNLHPVAILLALSFWGLLWGIVGMFLAAPITAGIRIILMQFDTLRPIANLLAGELRPAPTSTRPSESLSAALPPE